MSVCLCRRICSIVGGDHCSEVGGVRHVDVHCVQVRGGACRVSKRWRLSFLSFSQARNCWAWTHGLLGHEQAPVLLQVVASVVRVRCAQ